MLRNSNLSKNAIKIIDEVSPLVGIDNWQAQIGGQDEVIDLDGDALIKHFRQYSGLDEGRIFSYLHDSSLLSARFEEQKLVLEGMGHKAAFRVVGFGDTDEVSTLLNLDTALDVSFRHSAKTRRIASILEGELACGELWRETYAATWRRR